MPYGHGSPLGGSLASPTFVDGGSVFFHGTNTKWTF